MEIHETTHDLFADVSVAGTEDEIIESCILSREPEMPFTRDGLTIIAKVYEA